MHVSLTPELDAMVKRKVESGLYNNASEVVRDALRFMIAHGELISLMKTNVLQKLVGPSKLKDRVTAQWSSFFTALGLEWRSVEEKCELFGISITPDFAVEGHRCLFHVVAFDGKPFFHGVFSEFAKTTHREIVVLAGGPTRGRYKAYLYLDPEHCDRAWYENEVEWQPYHFGLARRALKEELCLCPNSFEHCENHINLAERITDDGERCALDDIEMLEDAYRRASQS